MRSKPQFRAGREVAEDVKRAVKRAIRDVGLKEHNVRMILGGDQSARIVMGCGKPADWRYKSPPLAVEIFVTTNGDIRRARVFCHATDQDPTMVLAGDILSVKNCECDLADLPQVLKGVWAEREELLAMLKTDRNIHDFTGRWHWACTQIF